MQWQQELAPDAWYDVLDGDEFPVGLADVGTRLRAVVTASNADGSTLATSAPTATVTAPAGARLHRRRRPRPTRRPTVTTVVPAPRPQHHAPAATPLRIVLRGGGRLAARLTARVATVSGGVSVTSATVRARAARGRWRLKLCAAARRPAAPLRARAPRP